MSNSLKISLAVDALQRGGVIAYPTEAVFGLGCDPDDPGALARLITLKERPADAGLILISATVEQALRHCVPPDAATLNLMEDAFVTVLQADGTDLVLSSYYGGTDHDMGRGIALDPSGNICIVGRTASNDLQMEYSYDDVLTGIVDAFLAKIMP